MKRAIAIIALTLLIGGCAHRKPPAPAPHGFSKTDIELAEAIDGTNRIIDHTHEPDTKAEAISVKGHLGGVGTGVEESKKDYAASVKQNDSSRAPFYHLLDLGSFISGIAMALGMALLVTSYFNGTGKIGVGLGVVALGGSGVLTFMLMRAVSPAMTILAYGVVAVTLAAFGYFVYDRFRARRQKLEREQKLADEQNATKEIVKAVDVGAAEDSLSDTTRALVKKARATVIQEAAASKDANTPSVTVNIEHPQAVRDSAAQMVQKIDEAQPTAGAGEN